MYLASDRRYQLFRLNAPTLFPCYFTMFTVVHEKAPCAALYQHHTACTFSFPTPIIWLTCLNLFSKLPQVDLLCFPICIQSQQRDAIRHVCASWKCLWLCTKTTWKRIETVEFYQKERERSLWWVLNSVRGREHSYIGRWCSHC